MALKDKYKYSFDMSEEVRDRLEKTKAYTYKPFGTIISDLSFALLDCPDEMQRDIRLFIYERLKALNNRLENSDAYAAKEIYSQIERYERMIPYFNNGADTIKMPNDELNLINYPFGGGRLIIPENWIILNEEMANTSCNAMVVECQPRFEVPIPHFVFFHNHLERNYPYNMDGQNEEINRLCCKKWERFSEVIALQVKHLYDPITHRLLNDDEIYNSPQIGYFPIPILGEDNIYSMNGKTLPYGACIIRKKGSK